MSKGKSARRRQCEKAAALRSVSHKEERANRKAAISIIRKMAGEQ